MLLEYPVLPDRNPFRRVDCDTLLICPPAIRHRSAATGRPHSARPKRSLRRPIPGHTQEQPLLTSGRSNNVTTIAPFMRTKRHSKGGAMAENDGKSVISHVMSKSVSLSGSAQHHLDQETVRPHPLALLKMMAPHPPTMPKHKLLSSTPTRPCVMAPLPMPEYTEQGILNTNIHLLLNTNMREVTGRDKWLQHHFHRGQITQEALTQHHSHRPQIMQEPLTRTMEYRQGAAKKFIDPWKLREKRNTHLQKASPHLLRLHVSGLEPERRLVAFTPRVEPSPHVAMPHIEFGAGTSVYQRNEHEAAAEAPRGSLASSCGNRSGVQLAPLDNCIPPLGFSCSTTLMFHRALPLTASPMHTLPSVTGSCETSRPISPSPIPTGW